MLKEKQGIFEGVDNRFGMVFSVFIDTILTDNTIKSTTKSIKNKKIYACIFFAGRAPLKMVGHAGLEPATNEL